VVDVFSQSHASLLVKGFENAAPVWLAQAPPCAFPIRVYPCLSSVVFNNFAVNDFVYFRAPSAASLNVNN
jgi:hypothetical protein